jgi:hypothetical protein
MEAEAAGAKSVLLDLDVSWWLYWSISAVTITLE